MYNQSLKERFIASITDSENTANAYRLVFRVSEPYETNAGLDLCQMDEHIGKPLANKLVGTSGASVEKRLNLAKYYVKWCAKEGVPGARLDFLNVSPNMYRNIMRNMVSGPIMLEEYLGQVFDRAEEETVHNTYRCYLWLGFLGVPKQLSEDLSPGSVDLERRIVEADGVPYEIYDEAMPVFRNCVCLSYFRSKQRYGTIVKPRSLGNQILRGMADRFSLNNLSIKVTTLEANALRDGKTTRRISDDRARLSGIFYRALNAEMAGIDAGFRAEAEKLTDEDTKQREGTTDKWVQQRIAARENTLRRDYERWKLAFFV